MSIINTLVNLSERNEIKDHDMHTSGSGIWRSVCVVDLLIKIELGTMIRIHVAGHDRPFQTNIVLVSQLMELLDQMVALHVELLQFSSFDIHGILGHQNR